MPLHTLRWPAAVGSIRDVVSIRMRTVSVLCLATALAAALGAVATTYRGVVVDLMGLNNVKMGHSPGDRIGMKNHAAFSIPVFWELQPDLVLPRELSNREELLEAGSAAAGSDARYLHGLMSTSRFRDRYRPIVVYRPGGGDFPSLHAYARVDWIARHAGSLQWADYSAVPGRAAVADQRRQ
jgi:hypothetical protein